MDKNNIQYEMLHLLSTVGFHSRFGFIIINVFIFTIVLFMLFFGYEGI